MNFIAIETSTNICSVSLFVNSQLKNILYQETKEHSKYLPVFVKKMLINNLNLDYIALSVGPGSFTGLKIATSFSKGLAAALQIPIIPINTFDGLRYGIKNIDNYYIAVYSHRNYAFSCLYNNELEATNYKCIEINKLDGYQIYGYGFPNHYEIEYQEIKPSSEKIGLISLEKYCSFKNKSINNISPMYLTLEK